MERGDALLAVDEEGAAFALVVDVGAEEVGGVAADLLALVQGVPLAEEALAEVVDQRADLVTGPGVLPLVVVQGEGIRSKRARTVTPSP